MHEGMRALGHESIMAWKEGMKASEHEGMIARGHESLMA
jgi:hypothetical protein